MLISTLSAQISTARERPGPMLGVGAPADGYVPNAEVALLHKLYFTTLQYEEMPSAAAGLARDHAHPERSMRVIGARIGGV